MNKSTNINNLNSFKSENFDWKLVQSGGPASKHSASDSGTELYYRW